jgi:hypothetical protein
VNPLDAEIAKRHDEAMQGLQNWIRPDGGNEVG